MMSAMDDFLFGEGFLVLFFGIFALVLITCVASLVRGVGRWHKNNQSPRLTVEALVVTKRTEVIHRYAGKDHGYGNVTNYYVTFQVESGDRMELSVTGAEYGMMAEGDRGRLDIQGTRFLSFERAAGI